MAYDFSQAQWNTLFFLLFFAASFPFFQVPSQYRIKWAALRGSSCCSSFGSGWLNFPYRQAGTICCCTSLRCDALKSDDATITRVWRSLFLEHPYTVHPRSDHMVPANVTHSCTHSSLATHKVPSAQRTHKKIVVPCNYMLVGDSCSARAMFQFNKKKVFNKFSCKTQQQQPSFLFQK